MELIESLFECSGELLRVYVVLYGAIFDDRDTAGLLRDYDDNGICKLAQAYCGAVTCTILLRYIGLHLAATIRLPSIIAAPS